MKVFFATAFSGKDKTQNTVTQVINALQEEKVEIISLELQSYDDILDERFSNLNEREKNYLYIKKGIDMANAVIIDASKDTFGIGYKATLALAMNKPVLCLSRSIDYSSYIFHPLFYAKKIRTDKNIQDAVHNFLRVIENKHLSIRFNSYISAEQKNFLDWCSRKTDRSISEIIRELINQEYSNHPEYTEDDAAKYIGV